MAMFDCATLRTILSLGFAIGTTMAHSDIKEFFPDIKGNLTKITWAHAVNNFQFLIDTLSNDDIMMIEADVVLGKVDGTGSTIPIMAHPPANTSDLSMLSFFLEVEKHNNDATMTKKKGVKLDFKSIEAFLKSVDVVKEFGKGDFPLWINADILPGPIKATTIPVDADQFLTGSKTFPDSTFSIGWTTLYGSNYSGSYEADQIQKMTDAITKNNVSLDITFPVRAGLAAESVDLLANLVGDVENSTITIWSSEGDNVNVDHLRNLIGKIGISKVYVDVPTDLLDKLHLDDLPNHSSTQLNVGVLGAVMSVLIAFINYCKF